MALEVLMLKLLFAISATLLFAFAQQPTTTTTTAASGVPADVAKMTNPVKTTPESQAKAKKLFDMDCAICHGEKGDGKGDVVSDLNLKMRDYTDSATLKNRTDGELFYYIKNGEPDQKMPPEAPRAKDDDIWNLVVYVRSLAKS
jgi:mono/diheme cytochrome c family protein